MAFYADEEEVWKCTQHPSRRRRSGICPVCLHERLSALCPDCANLRPCPCCASSASSSSFFFISFSIPADSSNSLAISGSGPAVGRMSNLINNEAGLGRSRSVSVPFFRSSRHSRSSSKDSFDRKSKSTSLWSLFRKRSKSKSAKEEEEEIEATEKMRRSKSVAVSDNGGRDEVRSAKSKGWYVPSPMKVFRQSKVTQEDYAYTRTSSKAITAGQENQTRRPVAEQRPDLQRSPQHSSSLD
ncbi:hypothetical protein Ancab_033017 [Ancistrocladus abbreviatus]